MQSSPTTLSVNPARDSKGPIISALSDVLRSEARLLRELAIVMQSQKEALATTDTQAVEDSVYAIHRVLHTLKTARERRRSINRILAASDEMAIGEFETVLGSEMTPDLRAACDDLRTSAGELGGMLDDTWDALRTAASVHSGPNAQFG